MNTRFRFPAILLPSVLSLILGSACNPQKKVQSYAYLLEDSPVYEKSSTGNTPKITEAKTGSVSKKEENGSFSDVPAPIRPVILEAYSYIGTPYKYGGDNRKGIDCSAFTRNCWAQVQIDLNRSARGQSAQGKKIPLKKAAYGDLIFFSAKLSGRVDHVGMIVENTDEGISFIHATTSKGVRIDRADTGYWTKRIMFVKRIETNDLASR